MAIEICQVTIFSDSCRSAWNSGFRLLVLGSGLRVSTFILYLFQDCDQ